jgi:antitoxin component of MazEF toxin-antitoxin module
MERKLVQIGSSLAVTLPAEVVHEFKLVKGQAVDVSVHPVTGAVTIRPGIKYFDDGKVSKRFDRIVDELLEKREKVYRELAK